MSTALVLGGAGCVWRDVEAALELGEFDAVVTCNDVTASWPGRIDACVSLHASSWQLWIGQRDRNGFSRPERVLGHLNCGVTGGPLTGVTDHKLPGQIHSGSSGLFAVKAAIVDLGCDRAVCCGIPMTVEAAHYFDAKDWKGAMAHRKGWLEAMPFIASRVRSMSGWTAERLGLPTPEWLGN